MNLTNVTQTLLFTFRPNGGTDKEPLVEVLVEDLADYDPAPGEGAYKREWFGTESEMLAMLEALGFESFDISGVRGALRDHRNADRRKEFTKEQLQKAGFKEIGQAG